MVIWFFSVLRLIDSSADIWILFGIFRYANL